MSNDNPPVDHVAEDQPKAESEMQQNLKSKSTWLRLVFMLVFCVLASVAGMVATVVIVLGFLWVLFSGEPNKNLQRAGQGIGAYLFEIVRYLSYNSEERPFPFDLEWPSSDAAKTETDEES